MKFLKKLCFENTNLIIFKKLPKNNLIIVTSSSVKQCKTQIEITKKDHNFQSLAK
jgi:hypothetical protein